MTDPMRWGDRMLHFGDPLDCDYRWLPPADLDDYAASVRLVGRKVQEAAGSLDLVDWPDAGLTADAMREHGVRLREELTRTQGNVRGVAAAMHAHADALRAHRDDLRDLRDHALAKGLDVRNGKVFAPVTTPPPVGTRAAERWQDDWEAYSTCFEWMRGIRTRRSDAVRELKAALLEHAGVRPRSDSGERDPSRGVGRVDHQNGSGAAVLESVHRLRREAARAAAGALRAEAESQEAASRLRRTRAEIAGVAEELAALRRSGADDAVLEAKRAELRGLEGGARDAAAEAHDRARAAERVRGDAHEAARDYEEARERRDGREGAGRARVSGL